jgi:hypothetical protein
MFVPIGTYSSVKVGSRTELVPVDSETCEDFGDYGGDMLYEEEGPPLYDPMEQVGSVAGM